MGRLGLEPVVNALANLLIMVTYYADWSQMIIYVVISTH